MNFFPLEILSTRKRSIDVYRGIAILLVILFHFDHVIEFGFIGVDLFFVISGYLVSRTFLKDLEQNKKVDWKTFFIKRITKILPSYYFFLIAGLIAARMLFIPAFPDEVISISDLPKYIFFYMNYDVTYVWSFEMAWSLCVEEHFYLFLTLVFVALTYVSFIKKKKKLLFYLILFFIIASNVYKLIGFHFNLDVSIATHARMDALFLGVLLSFQEINQKVISGRSKFITAIGILCTLITISCFYIFESDFYSTVVIHILAPISFYLLIRGTLNFNFKGTLFLRVLAYYSYNWYLWHSIIAFIILNLFELNKTMALAVFLVSSFTIAVLVTKFIEEPFLNLRSRFKGLKKD